MSELYKVTLKLYFKNFEWQMRYTLEMLHRNKFGLNLENKVTFMMCSYIYLETSQQK